MAFWFVPLAVTFKFSTVIYPIPVVARYTVPVADIWLSNGLELPVP